MLCEVFFCFHKNRFKLLRSADYISDKIAILLAKDRTTNKKQRNKKKLETAIINNLSVSYTVEVKGNGKKIALNRTYIRFCVY